MSDIKRELIELEQIGGEKVDGVISPISYNVFYAPNLVPLGQIYKEVDGFYVFEFKRPTEGCWAGEVLLELGAKVVELNKAWREQLSKTIGG
jgi:hypothetical protein